MTDAAESRYWVNYEAGMELAQSFAGDIGLSQFVMRAVTLTMNHCLSGKPPPATPLDLRFFVQMMAALYEQRNALARIFEGEDLRAWADDD
ncbi:hypothetical protein D7V97_22755 [Corallococcus sp. CA053C]|nr:hypothetical protein D7V97_22755 [Corallococcus sp. CA053C]